MSIRLHLSVSGFNGDPTVNLRHPGWKDWQLHLWHAFSYQPLPTYATIFRLILISSTTRKSPPRSGLNLANAFAGQETVLPLRRSISLFGKSFPDRQGRHPGLQNRLPIGNRAIPLRKSICRFAKSFADWQSHFPISKVVSQSAKSFPNQQSRFPISKAVSQPAKLFASQQSRLLTGRVIPRSAESFADQQSYSAISKVVSRSAKLFPDQQSRFLLGEGIS
jgi:hypothetical protein